MCTPAIFETSFSYEKDIWIAASDCYMHFYIIVLFPLAAILQLIKFYSFINFSLLTNTVILPLNCLVLILYLYIHFLSLRCYFLYLNIIWSFMKVSRSLYCVTTSIYHGVENYFPRLWGISDAIFFLFNLFCSYQLKMVKCIHLLKE